jgi:hypothetical protein
MPDIGAATSAGRCHAGRTSSACQPKPPPSLGGNQAVARFTLIVLKRIRSATLLADANSGHRAHRVLQRLRQSRQCHASISTRVTHRRAASPPEGVLYRRDGGTCLATRHEEIADRIPPQEVAELLGEVTVCEVRQTLTCGLPAASKTKLVQQQARSRFH